MNRSSLAAFALAAIACQRGEQQPAHAAALSASNPVIAGALRWMESADPGICPALRLVALERRDPTPSPPAPPQFGFRDIRGRPIPEVEWQPIATAARRLQAEPSRATDGPVPRLQCHAPEGWRTRQLLPIATFSAPRIADDIAFVEVDWHWGRSWIALRSTPDGWVALGWSFLWYY